MYPHGPPKERGTLICFVVALAVHVMLGVLLYHGVHWISRTPVGMEAELWEPVPDTAVEPSVQAHQQAQPPAARPEAKPEADKDQDADIVLREEKPRRAAKPARPAQAAPPRERKAREPEPPVDDGAQRQSELARLQDMARSTPASGADGTGAGGQPGAGAGAGGTTSPGYGDKVRRRVLPNIVFDEDIEDNPTAVVAVHLAPDGSILSARISKSSGHAGWDNAVLRAVQRSNPLPRDDSGVAPANINIYFQPKE